MSAESQSSRRFTHEVLDNPEKKKLLEELARLASSVPDAPPEPKVDASPGLLSKFSDLARGRERLFRALAGAVFALASGTEMLNDMSDIMSNKTESTKVLEELQAHVEEKRRRMAQTEAGIQSIRRAA